LRNRASVRANENICLGRRKQLLYNTLVIEALKDNINGFKAYYTNALDAIN